MLALPTIWQDWLEVMILAIGIYLILRFLRQTRGSGVVRGLSLIIIFGGMVFLLLIELLKLQHLAVFFDLLVGAALLGMIIVFHPEIRNAIVRLGETPIFGGFLRREVKTTQRLLRSVARLSRDRIGALIAMERDGSLSTLAETGITVDAELNSYLIESIFFPGSALHDGAVIIRDDRIVAASCLLPLSQNPDVDKRLGTRHRAALGVSEETDAFAIVVSEETGKVSAAVAGRLHHGLKLDELETLIEDTLVAERRRR